MQISSRAWHLRLVRKMHNKNYMPSDLCHYFWRVAGTVAWLSVLAFGVFMWITWIVGQRWVFMGMILGAGIGGALFLILLKALADRFYSRESKPAKLPKEPGLVLSYIKARKERYCPLIEVVED